jgi:N-acetylmuramic acid 6-phosphate (MurNAc-6-P) etherase
MVVGGRVTGNFMTEMTGTNSKLRGRAIDIVHQLCGLDELSARQVLEQAGWHVGRAVQLARTKGLPRS